MLVLFYHYYIVFILALYQVPIPIFYLNVFIGTLNSDFVTYAIVDT